MLTYDPNESLNLPEGHYRFQVREEPEKRKQTSAKGNEYTMYIFKFMATNEVGSSRKYSDVFVHWDERWKDLLLALGGKTDDKGIIHLSETTIVGKQFEADIKHEPNPNKPNEIRGKLINIVALNDVPQPTLVEDEEISPPEEEDEAPF